MVSRKIYVGIDVSKKNLDVYISLNNMSKSFVNCTKEIEELVSFLVEIKAYLIVIEATGGLEKEIVDLMIEKGLRVTKINPIRARRFAEASNLAKTDKVDAKMLCKFGYAFESNLEIVKKLDGKEDKIKELSTRRKQLLKIKVQEFNRSRWIKDSDLLNSIKRVNCLIEEEIKLIEIKIRELIKSSDKLNNKFNIIKSFPGMGEKTTNQVIGSLPELGSIEKKKIARLVGVAPINNDSGMFKGKRSIKGGRFHVRASLYMATLSATRHNPQIKAFYQKLLSKGKLKKVALIACMHKLIHILNSMVANNVMWQNP